ncbi:MAG: alpha/beta hydrolase [Rhodocyclales bacterium]|nr:alpha/beta hydrolase [Rhodocyclales bacterium]
MDVTVAGQPAYVYTGGKQPASERSAAQPVVVFIHGAQQDHSCWSLQSRWFAHHGFLVLVPDLPGHGRSGGAPLASIEALADWLIALLDAVGVGRANLVGHSMGSLIALEATVRHPDRIGKTALIGAAVPMPVSEPLLDAAWHDEPRAAAMINTFSYSPSGQIGRNTVPGLWLLSVNRRLMERQKPGVFGTDMAACNAYGRSLESLAGVATPVLLIAGSHDRMTPLKASRALAAALPVARLTVIPGSGHALMAEAPDAVLDSLKEFIS